MLTALVNISFGFFHSVTAFTALWFLNGSLQVEVGKLFINMDGITF